VSDPGAVLPKYNVAIVAQVILEVAVDLDPEHLKIDKLALRVVGDSKDHEEMTTAAQAISDLRESGLFTYKDDEAIVKPTPAALLAVALLT
jgi:hypothetical protein